MPLSPVIALAANEVQRTLGKRLWAGILLWALTKGDAPFGREQQKGLEVEASQESSMTLRAPAASSPTIVNTDAICHGLSILQPRPAVAATLFHWLPAGKATGRRQERRRTLPLSVGHAGQGTQQGALKDIPISHAETPPKAPSGAFIKWQQAIFIQHKARRASTKASCRR